MITTLPKVYEPLLLTFYGEPRRVGTWLVIGDDYRTELRMDTAGRVHSVDPSGRLPDRFVNSSVDNLARFIEAHRNLTGILQSHPEETVQVATVNSFREQLEIVDPMAFSDEENWWAIVVEQMRRGVL